MKEVMKKMVGGSFRCIGNWLGRALCAFAFLFAFVFALAGRASAQTDIGSALTTLSGYQTAAIVIGMAVLLWVVGRMLVHKFTRG